MAKTASPENENTKNRLQFKKGTHVASVQFYIKSRHITNSNCVGNNTRHIL